MRAISPESVRQAAKDLRARHRDLTNQDLKHTQALEMVAVTLGYANRHAMMAALSPATIPESPVYVGHGSGTAMGHEIQAAVARGLRDWLKLPHAPNIDLDLKPERLMMDYAVLARGPEPDQLFVALIRHNDAPFDFFEDGDDGDLISGRDFASEDAYKAFLDERLETGRLALPVQRYSHGLDHYSIQGSQSYPDMRFDVASCTHLYLPPDEIADQHKNGELSYDELVAYANRVLNRYSMYVNGDNWMITPRLYQITPEAQVTFLEEDGAADVVGEDEVPNVIADMLGQSEPAAPLARG
ncbi:hypothetical protein CKO28_03275 [Rhodovibrio sodomensis]|uniref:Glyoxalase-related protein domain-containing protein n=1 Tax=Rhodovibrio sodomensis TaxID=1088 RepID=A0ABS1D9H0_9PROT|nr:glyoxalase superfamily protein [Rhodovibrio sodomensis]MBK1667066.1 hypothetical protein [Rhodovibrio sodomensis]